MKKPFAARIRFLFSGVMALVACAVALYAQAIPYARSYPQPKPQIELALKELQASSGQKLPVLDGFVAPGQKQLDRYERGFYQFSIEMVPGDNGATIVRLSAKITAWYADKDVAKSGYEVLPSNGRLELDLLDRLQEKLTGKPVDPPATLQSNVQAPLPKLDLSGVPGASISSPVPAAAKSPDEVTALRNQRVLEERRVQQLTTELQTLKDIQHNQSRPQNLVSVENSGTPIYAKASEESHVLFQAAANDEFEFLDLERGWIHIAISGDSRGYVREGAVLLPELLVAKMSEAAPGPELKFPGFRLERQETGSFPGDWTPLKGKIVKIYTVQPVSQNLKESGPAARLAYALELFETASKESAAVSQPPDGVVVIFDAADGGIAGATLPDIRKFVAGSLTREALWAQSYLDPIETFRPSGK